MNCRIELLKQKLKNEKRSNKMQREENATTQPKEERSETLKRKQLVTHQTTN